MTNLKQSHPHRHRLVQELRDLAMERGFKFYNLTDESGVSSHTLTSWSNGTRGTPTIERFERVLRVLGCQLAIVPIDTSASRGNSTARP